MPIELSRRSLFNILPAVTAGCAAWKGWEWAFGTTRVSGRGPAGGVMRFTGRISPVGPVPGRYNQRTRDISDPAWPSP